MDGNLIGLRDAPPGRQVLHYGDLAGLAYRPCLPVRHGTGAGAASRAIAMRGDRDSDDHAAAASDYERLRARHGARADEDLRADEDAGARGYARAGAQHGEAG